MEATTRDWYLTQGGQQVGPYSTEQLRQFVAAGQISSGDMVWKDGMAQWAPINTVPEWAGAVAAPAAAPATLSYAMPASSGAACLATPASLEMLRKTKPWVRLISIVICRY